MANHALPVLVFGSTGQIGRELMARPSPSGFRVIGVTHSEADVTKPEAIRRVIEFYGPVAIVNATGYTAVDRSETEPDTALSVNGHASGHLASAAAAVGAAIIQLSSCYIFDGNKTSPYNELDRPAPLGVYGRTKLIGEDLVRKANPRHVILRTGWIYSDHGQNFLTTMLRLASTRDEVRVVSDQIGSPTAAPDLAGAIYELLPQILSSSGTFGVYHFTNSGTASWYNFAKFIFNSLSQRGHRAPVVTPIKTDDYPIVASRPKMSVLDCTRINEDYRLWQRTWSEAAASVLENIFRSRDSEMAFGANSKRTSEIKEHPSTQKPIRSRSTRDERVHGKKAISNGNFRPRTKVGQAILRNSEQVVVASAALLLSIDRRLAALGNELPNSEDRKRAMREEIENYEFLRKTVAVFHDVVLKFINGGVTERAAVDSTKTFAQGIDSWWTTRHKEICQRAFEMSLFLSAVGLCTAAGASGTISVVVSGALLGGKPVVQAVRAISKSLSPRQRPD